MIASVIDFVRIVLLPSKTHMTDWSRKKDRKLTKTKKRNPYNETVIPLDFRIPSHQSQWTQKFLPR